MKSLKVMLLLSAIATSARAAPPPAATEDDPALRMFGRHRNLHCRCGGQADIGHIHTHALQRAEDKVIHHLSGDTGIPPDNDLYPFISGVSRCDPGGIRRCEFYYIQGA